MNYLDPFDNYKAYKKAMKAAGREIEPCLIRAMKMQKAIKKAEKAGVRLKVAA
jgi:hypothetical protein